MHLEDLIEQARRTLSSAEKGPGRVTRPLPGLMLRWQRAPSAFEAALYDPILCLILQGRKQVTIGEQRLSFGPGECLLVSHDLHVSSRVTKAPYLALVLKVDVATVRGLQEEVSAPAPDGERAAVTYRAERELLDALRRYLALAEAPAHAKVLGPLISKEIHYRLLTAQHGGMLRSLIQHDSNASAISRAIGHIRGQIRSPIVVPDLARRVGMSPSAFHKHFRTITSTTPVQYQKELRLLEARRLLKTGAASVTSAAFEVGYESSSQFSREYSRKFGIAPSRELADGA